MLNASVNCRSYIVIEGAKEGTVLYERILEWFYPVSANRSILLPIGKTEPRNLSNELTGVIAKVDFPRKLSLLIPRSSNLDEATDRALAVDAILRLISS